MVWVAGQQLYGGRYVIEGVLGEGGFGITYLATDKQGKKVAIKTVKDEVLNATNLRSLRNKYQRDFENEALRLSLCRHRHIVKIENAFHEDKLPCMVMEYIEGEDLWQRVNRQGILSETEALLYIHQIAEALIIIHEKGLLHRDIKPHNILLRHSTDRINQLEAVLIDFGMVREFIPDITLTQTQQLTHCFAPIEQYAKEAKRGEFTDIYALAATLYYILTKQLPTPAPARAARDILKPPQEFNSSISDVVNHAILKGMEFHGENRPQSVIEWLNLWEFNLSERLEISPVTSVDIKIRRILWVDDNPANPGERVTELRNRGIEVILATSTNEAMEILISNSFQPDVVVSDLVRFEEGEYRVDAGILLIKIIRGAGITVPIFIYSAPWRVASMKEEVLAAGVTSTIASPVELFKLLLTYINPLENPHNIINNSDNLISSVEINYSKLRDLLAAGKWQEADEATRSLMLQVFSREEEDWLNEQQIEQFPCEDLHTIDQLWLKYSNGQFGFSIQKRIWLECGGKPDAGYETYRVFVERIGWRVDGNWLSWFDLTFSLNAPEGHLPLGLGRGMVDFGLAFLSRVESCGL